MKWDNFPHFSAIVLAKETISFLIFLISMYELSLSETFDVKRGKKSSKKSSLSETDIKRGRR